MISGEVSFVVHFEYGGFAFEVTLSREEAPRLSKALCYAEQSCERQGWRLLRIEDRLSGEVLEPCPKCPEEEAQDQVCSHCRGRGYLSLRPIGQVV
jgi:hypothetical protein